MHKLFREALNDATGESKHIIAVIIDIRGFSSFSHQCESVDVAAYIRKVYMKIIDIYFSFASFYKPTGDGLILTIPWDEESLQEISQKVIASSIKCHSEFCKICENEPAINFDVPEEVGMGVARGSACCLVSGDKVIDYSGRLLNLTARLMDLARPSGIVIDGAFGIDLLTEAQQKLFKEYKVYLDGIAEYEPVKIYFTKEFTEIPRRNRQPIAERRWRRESEVKPFRELLKLDKFIYYLESEPLNPDEIAVKVHYPATVKGRVHKGYLRVYDFKDFEYDMEAGKPALTVDFRKMCSGLEKRNVKKNMNIRIDIDYVEK